jgi:plastocyanin
MPIHRILSLVAGLSLPLVSSAAAQVAPVKTVVSGRLTVLDRGNRSAADVGQSVIWLELAPTVPPPRMAQTRTETFTEGKQFLPRVSVVPAGSTIAFPNHDPFNHNVFSLSPEARFDLGLYGRGEAKSAPFPRAGIVRVYCNVHPQMSAIVVVRDNPYYTQPGADGSFTLNEVPPGSYVLHAWHERGGETTRAITVPAGGLRNTALQLDARGYRFVQHLNKFGQPYTQQGRRY